MVSHLLCVGIHGRGLGFQAWMIALPEPVLTLFGVVMTGYVAGRSWEKVRGAAK